MITEKNIKRNEISWGKNPTSRYPIRFEANISTYELKTINDFICHVDEFARLTGVRREAISIRAEASRGYYDEIDVEYEFSGSRDETDEEFETRQIEVRHKAERDRIKKEREDQVKTDNERKTYERLKQKFEGGSK